MPPPGNKELEEPRKVCRKVSFFFFVFFYFFFKTIVKNSSPSLHFSKSASWRSQQQAVGSILMPSPYAREGCGPVQAQRGGTACR